MTLHRYEYPLDPPVEIIEPAEPVADAPAWVLIVIGFVVGGIAGISAGLGLATFYGG